MGAGGRKEKKKERRREMAGTAVETHRQEILRWNQDKLCSGECLRADGDMYINCIRTVDARACWCGWRACALGRLISDFVRTLQSHVEVLRKKETVLFLVAESAAGTPCISDERSALTTLLRPRPRIGAIVISI